MIETQEFPLSGQIIGTLRWLRPSSDQKNVKPTKVRWVVECLTCGNLFKKDITHGAVEHCTPKKSTKCICQRPRDLVKRNGEMVEDFIAGCPMYKIALNYDMTLEDADQIIRTRLSNEQADNIIRHMDPHELLARILACGVSVRRQIVLPPPPERIQETVSGKDMSEPMSASEPSLRMSSRSENQTGDDDDSTRND